MTEKNNLVCPFHNDKCEMIDRRFESLEKKVDKMHDLSLPRWVFVLSVSVLLLAISYVGYELRAHNDWLMILNNNQIKVLHELRIDSK